MSPTSPSFSLPSPKERRRLREALSLSEEHVAEALGVTRATVRSWETGRSAPRGRKREAYAKLLGVHEEPAPAQPEKPARPAPDPTRPRPATKGVARPPKTPVAPPGASATGPAPWTTDDPRQPEERLKPAPHGSGVPETGADAPERRRTPAHGPAPAGAADRPLPDAGDGATAGTRAGVTPTGDGTTTGTTAAGADDTGTGVGVAAAGAGDTAGGTAAGPGDTAGVTGTGPGGTGARPAGPARGPAAARAAGSGGAATAHRTATRAQARAEAAERIAGAAGAAGGPAGLTPEEAFDALYAYAAPSLVHQTYLLTGRRMLSRESVEQAFHHAWQHWPEVAVDRDPVGWVRAAAYEYALSPWHRFRRRHRHPDTPPTEASRRALLGALLDLPPAYRRTVLLYDGLGLDLPETAAETEASTPAAGNRLLHARTAIARRLPELADPEELHLRLSTLVAEAPTTTLPAARSVRSGSERRIRLLTQAVFGVTAALIGLTAFTVATAPTRYIPVNAPGAVVEGVPVRGGPQKLRPEDKELREMLRTAPNPGPERLVPRPD
ncbi:helix-turn-helix domain-containing protein [Streptomyces sp. NPDC048018]|uniref:helix-turn-helix domain-containing protein n=1 Tax=Streptomyces sp. NPDC048018 TaxID=3365499 RepID=UPI003719B1A7